MKRISAFLLCAALCMTLCSCAEKTDNVTLAATNGFDPLIPADQLSTLESDKNEKPGYQLALPEIGEEIAVVTTNKGIIKIRLFPNAAPKAVYNFKALASSGYYDGLTFHRVIKGFMIQGGDPDGTGNGGQSIWGTPFSDEFNSNLLNLCGAVSMANVGADTNKSQFFINQASTAEFKGWDYWQNAYEQYVSDPATYTSQNYVFVNMKKISSEVKALYTQYGGNPWLDGKFSTSGKGHTVFGQVFEGMEVVNSIAGVTVNSKYKPLDDMIIEKIEIVVYEG